MVVRGIMPWTFPRLRFLSERSNLLLCATLLAACSPSASPAPLESRASGRAPSAAQLSAPLDLDASLRASRARFHAEDGRWIGAGPAHQIAATADGFEIVPVAPPASKGASPRGGAPLRVKKARVTRGGLELGRGAGVGRVEKDGHLVVARGEVEEHLENRDAGVEFSYSFARAPEGAGDLTVALDVTGEQLVGETPGGLHFADPASGLGMRFGQATWIDATGKKTRVRVRSEEGRLVMRVPERVLASSAYPAVLDPLVSPEFGIDTPIAFLPGGERRFRPAVAWNGTHYLVAWEENRFLDPVQDKRIYAARVAADGTVLDATGFAVVEGADPVKPALASDGKGFFLTYQTGSASMISNKGVYGQRLDGNGQPVGAPITLSTSTQINRKTRVAFDGANYLVAWIDTAKGYYGRVSPAGASLDPGGISLGSSTTLDVASDGAGALLVRMASGVVYAHRVDAQGALLDPAGIAVVTPSPTQYEFDPVPVWAGNNYFLAYGEYDDDTYDTNVKGMRFDAKTGTVLDPNGIFIKSLLDRTELDATFDGTNVLVTWCSYNQDYVAYPLQRARVSPQGTVLDPGGVTYTNLGADGQGASNGAHSLVVWMNAYFDGFFPGGYSIMARRFAPNGMGLDASPILVSKGANEQRAPSAAFDGQNFVVAWSDARDFLLAQDRNLYTARVTTAGVSLDPNAIAVEHAVGDIVHTSTVFDGTNTLLGFANCVDGYDYYSCSVGMNRMDAQGTMLDPLSISAPAFDEMSSRVALSVGAGATLFVGTGYDPNTGDEGLFTQTRNASGQFSPGTTIAPDWAPSALSASFDGTNHLVAWQTNNKSSLRMIRVDAQGAPLGASPTVLAGSGSFGGISTVFDGTNHVVVWVDSAAQKLFGLRVSPDGAVLDAMPIELASHPGCAYLGLAERGAVVDGGRTVVAYRACGPTLTDVAAVVLSGNLSVITSLPITSDDRPKSVPSLASTNGGEVLVTYASFHLEAPLGTPRIQGRIIDFTSCTMDAECNGGQCVSGICLNEGPVGTGSGGAGGTGGNGGAGAGGAGGMGGVGGAGGMGGATSSSGAGGMGGASSSSGAGGMAGSGGMDATTGAGGAEEPPPVPDGDDCACEAAGQGTTSLAPLASALVALLGAAGRRRNRARAS